MANCRRENSLLVEPLNSTTGTAGLLVGVCALPVLEVEGGLGEVIEGVLLLGESRGSLLLIVISGLGSSLGLGGGGGLLSLRCLFLGGGNELEALLGVDDVAVELLDLGLVVDGLEVADEVGEGLAGSGIDGGTDGLLEEDSDPEVSEGDALADEEGVVLEVGLEGVQGTGLALEEGVVGLSS